MIKTAKAIIYMFYGFVFLVWLYFLFSTAGRPEWTNSLSEIAAILSPSVFWVHYLTEEDEEARKETVRIAVLSSGFFIPGLFFFLLR